MQMIRTDGWAAQYLDVGTNIRVMELKNRALSQYGVGGGGGVVDKKKISATPPVKFGWWG